MLVCGYDVTSLHRVQISVMAGFRCSLESVALKVDNFVSSTGSPWFWSRVSLSNETFLCFRRARRVSEAAIESFVSEMEHHDA